MATLKDRIRKLRKGEPKKQAPPEQAPADSGGKARPQPKKSPEKRYSVGRSTTSLGREQYQELKRKIHRRMLDVLDLSILSEMDEEEVQQ
ncbi:MAG: hypothetical protein R6V05_01465, partial [Candidatus Brocadiia bacterium]